MKSYEDIIDMPHHVSKRHPQMPIEDRAAQFSAFAALSGHEEAIEETARLTESWQELDENKKELLDNRLMSILSDQSSRENVMLTYFVPDEKKSGGSFKKISGEIKRIDEYRGCIVLRATSGQIMEIAIDKITEIEQGD